MTLTLYSMPSSGNSYKVRLLLSLMGKTFRHIGLEYETPEIEAAHRNRVLPLGKMPVLELPDGNKISESNAILWYLAEGSAWIPEDPVARAEMLGWMFFEQNRHETVIAVRAALRKYRSRAHLATTERMAELLEAGHSVLQIMDDRLKTHDYLAGERISIADISLYAYTHTAHEHGGFDMEQFEAIRSWLERISSLNGYVALNELPS
ncbi:MAG: glutathione S-transferase family protein [Boseongicola sp.]|nr:MAG: glutathione S-transferase family protein [Boseongicola sp.]